jgi:peptidyl-prolyl cis-trans isomerase A (cyclophilin A)
MGRAPPGPSGYGAAFKGGDGMLLHAGMFRGAVAALVISAALGLSACSGGEPTQAPEEGEKVEAKEPTPAPAAEQPAPAADDVMAPPADAKPALLDPALANETAPPEYKVKFETTKGDFVVLVHKDWAPIGADRFYNLVKAGFYDQAKFFRAIDAFMVQFGISPYPAVSEKWRAAKIDDDPVKESNTRGKITFATAGPNSRTTQVFINYVDDNSKLDPMGFAPFGEVVEGMDVVDSLYKGYGEGAPRGRGPDQGRVQARGNAYLEKQFPELDGIKSATIVE